MPHNLLIIDCGHLKSAEQIKIIANEKIKFKSDVSKTQFPFCLISWNICDTIYHQTSIKNWKRERDFLCRWFYCSTGDSEFFLIKNNFYDAMIMAIWEVFMIFEYFDISFGYFQEILQIWSQSWHHLKSPKQIPPQPLNLFFNFFGYRFPAYFPVLCFLYISKESLTCTRLDIDKKSCYSCYPSKKEEKFFKTNFKQQGKFYFFAVISQ